MKSSKIRQIRIKIILILFSVITLCVGSMVYAETNWSFVPPKSYIAYRLDQSITLDGKADETAWENAQWSDLFVDIEGNKKPVPRFNTRVKMLWDENFLYIYAELEEPHVWGDITTRDEVIFYNNDFEVFIKTSSFATQYVEFEMNALGTVWDLLLFNTYRHNVPVVNEWDMKGIKIGIDVEGSLNNAEDTDKGWNFEIALPLKDIAETGSRNNLPKDGSQWQLNFSRVQWQHEMVEGKYQRKKNALGKYLPEDNWVWSPQGIIAMHQPETWGILQFSTNTKSSTTFIANDEQVIEQSLYYLYRQQLQYFNEHGHYAKTIDALISLPLLVNNQRIDARLITTLFGYEISVNNTKTKLTSVINQHSQLQRIPMGSGGIHRYE
ncbi:MAG: hypothetical protein ACI9YH_000017 [Colwellia sp.]|jgi:hypothetical protein